MDEPFNKAIDLTTLIEHSLSYHRMNMTSQGIPLLFMSLKYKYSVIDIKHAKQYNILR